MEGEAQSGLLCSTCIYFTLSGSALHRHSASKHFGRLDSFCSKACSLDRNS